MNDKTNSMKLLTPVLFVSLLVLGGLVAYVSLTTYRRELQHIEDFTASLMKSFVLNLEVKTTSIESVLVAESHRNDLAESDTAGIYDCLVRLLQDNSFINNVCIDFWEEKQDSDMNDFSITYYAANDSTGHIAHGYKIVRNIDINSFELDSYNKALATGEPCWSQPYDDTLFTDYYMTTCYMKCERKGVVLCSDVRVATLLQNIRNLQFYNNSQLYVVDAIGNTYALSRDDNDIEGISADRVPAIDTKNKEFIFITTHYDTLDIDIVNVVPKSEIHTSMWMRALVIFSLFFLALIILAFLNHRYSLKVRANLAATIRKSADEEMALRQIESDIAIAAGIQDKMLTSQGKGTHIVPVEGYPVDVMSLVIPAREVGGDLYEYQQVGTHLVMCVGDVSGKGIPASIIMTKCCTLFHAYLSDATVPDPSAMLSYMNVQLCRRNEEMMFVTLWIGVLDLLTGTVRYASAGHNPPVLLKDDCRFLEACQGVPLGMFEDATYTTVECCLAAGDALLLYTDGITEAEGPDHVLFGDERLLDACRSSLSHCPQVVTATVLQAVSKHAQECTQSDDITLLCLTFSGHYAQLHGIDDVIALHTFADECGCSYRTALVMEELAVNAFQHGGATFVSAEYCDGLFVMVHDGDDFNPVTYLTSTPCDDGLSIGGRGISLVRSLCSTLDFQRTANDWNRITFKVNEL